MTGSEASADTPQPAPSRPRWHLPASRGGVAWLIVLLIIGTLLAVQFGRQVYANWEIGQRAAEIEAQIAAVDAENARLQAELDYLRSDAYVSAEARRLANLGTAGEQVLIIPPGAEEPLPEELCALEPPKPLLEQWIQLFFGPSTKQGYRLTPDGLRQCAFLTKLADRIIDPGLARCGQPVPDRPPWRAFDRSLGVLLNRANLGGA